MKVGIVPGLSREMLLGRDWVGANKMLNLKESLQGDCVERIREMDFLGESSCAQTRLRQQNNTTLQDSLKKAGAEGDVVMGEVGFELLDGL